MKDKEMAGLVSIFVGKVDRILISPRICGKTGRDALKDSISFWPKDSRSIPIKTKWDVGFFQKLTWSAAMTKKTSGGPPLPQLPYLAIAQENARLNTKAWQNIIPTSLPINSDLHVLKRPHFFLHKHIIFMHKTSPRNRTEASFVLKLFRGKKTHRVEKRGTPRP